LTHFFRGNFPLKGYWHEKKSVSIKHLERRGIDTQKGFQVSLLPYLTFNGTLTRDFRPLVFFINRWTLTHFQLIWIAEKFLRSNYTLCVSVFLAISCENGIFGPKKFWAPYKRSECFFFLK
jgi:hypothetical protein